VRYSFGRSRLGVGLLLPAAIVSAGAAASATARLPGTSSHCKGGEVRAAIVSFTRAFDRGDYESLDSLFAQPPEYQWYTTPGPGRVLAKGARGRASLISYFEARHARRDRLHLTEFQFNGNAPHWGNFGFAMRHSAAGFMGGRPFPQGGKGAAICDSAGIRFIVFTFGEPGELH
jgi:hypothetical protein